MTSALERGKMQRLRRWQAGFYACYASCVNFLNQFPDCRGASGEAGQWSWEDTAEPGVVFPHRVPPLSVIFYYSCTIYCFTL